MVRKLTAVACALALAGCGSIESNHVGVRTGFTGKVNTTELTQGFYTSILSSVDEYSCKEITVELFDMTPKVADNLSLKDFDVEIYYTADCSQVAELKLQYTGRDAWKNGLGLPAYFLVQSLGRQEAYEAAARYDSLEIHKNRDQLKDEIMHRLQSLLDEKSPGAFKITNVVIRSVITDPSIEQSIKLAVGKSKELEARQKEVQIAKQQALAYQELNASLTDEILRNKYLDILDKAVESEKVQNMYLIVGDNEAQPMLQLPQR